MVLDLMIIGLAITLEPITLVAFILILAAENGTRKGLAFILGWLACLVVVIAVVVLVTGGKPPQPSTAPSTAALVIKAALGVVLILFGSGSGAAGAAPASRPRGWRGWTVSRHGLPPGLVSSCSPGRWWPPARRRSCKPNCPARGIT